MVEVRDIAIEQGEHEKSIRCRVSGKGMPDELFFDISSSTPFGSKMSRVDCIAVGLIYPAMMVGESLYIDGPISSDLLFDLNNDIQSLLISYNPMLKRVKVIGDPVAPCNHGRDICTGFSAGVDTFATLSMYGDDAAPASRKISTLSTFHVGAMGVGQSSDKLYEAYCARLRLYCDQYNFKSITNKSNLGDFYLINGGGGFQKTHVIRNAAAALCFSDELDSYLYSSTYPYREINTHDDDMAYIEPILLPLLSHSVRFFSAGAGLARLDKMKIISNYPPASSMLDVCVSSAERRLNAEQINCSQCWKCARAMLNLDVLGRLDKFSNVFDVDYFKKNRNKYIQIVTNSAMQGKPADRDLIELISLSRKDTRTVKWHQFKYQCRSFLGRMRRVLMGKVLTKKARYRM